MAFRKFQKAESVKPVDEAEGKAIRKVVKEAGVKSASQLTDAQRRNLPR